MSAIEREALRVAVDSLDIINKEMAESNRLMFERFADDTKLLMRCYEMLFIGRTDVSKEELKDLLTNHLIDTVSKEKFQQWVAYAGHDGDHREWDFLYKINGVRP